MAELFVGKQISKESFELTQGEVHHCMRVMRHRIGDDILITQFDGCIYLGTIESVEKERVLVNIKKTHSYEPVPDNRLAIGISLTQQADRFEWFLEKAVENGIHDVFPLICERTESKKMNVERMHRIMYTAAKQTLRPLLPVLHGLIPFKSIFQHLGDFSQRFIGHCEEEANKNFLGASYQKQSSAIVFIGPAGDFTPKEIEWAISNDCIPISLGPYRLRTETAGLTALQILQTIRQL